MNFKLVMTSLQNLYWTRFLSTLPASYATSRSAVERDSCGPDLRATLLAARLLNEFLAALLHETEWIGLGWDLEELSNLAIVSVNG